MSPNKTKQKNEEEKKKRPGYIKVLNRDVNQTRKKKQIPEASEEESWGKDPGSKDSIFFTIP